MSKYVRLCIIVLIMVSFLGGTTQTVTAEGGGDRQPHCLLQATGSYCGQAFACDSPSFWCDLSGTVHGYCSGVGGTCYWQCWLSPDCDYPCPPTFAGCPLLD